MVDFAVCWLKICIFLIITRKKIITIFSQNESGNVPSSAWQNKQHRQKEMTKKFTAV
jgi:hypothetical protein